jgi:hypothetical protein
MVDMLTNNKQNTEEGRREGGRTNPSTLAHLSSPWYFFLSFFFLSMYVM